MSELARLCIPCCETDSGFEAQEFFTEQIRELEKAYRPSSTLKKDSLRDDVDRLLMQSKSFDEFLERLQSAGYTIKEGKHLAVKAPKSDRFIRLKSLGENYYEQALRNRIQQKLTFENDISAKIASNKNPNSLEFVILKTMRQYTILFAQNILLAKCKNTAKPFSWTNGENLDRLSQLNKRVNEGLTLDGLWNEFKAVEQSVTEKVASVETLKSELEFFEDLLDKGRLCFEQGNSTAESLQILREHNITRDNYLRIENLVEGNKTEIAQLEKQITDEQAKLKDLSELLTLAEQVAGGTYVQMLIAKEKERRQAEALNAVR